jgi:hypothetical protein
MDDASDSIGNMAKADQSFYHHGSHSKTWIAWMLYFQPVTSLIT